MLNVKIKKIGESVPVDWDRLPEKVQDFIKMYGLKQVLADSASAVATTDLIDGRRVPKPAKVLAEARAKARVQIMARLDLFYRGVLKKVREGGGLDLDSIMRRHALSIVQKSGAWKRWVAENGLKADDDDYKAELSARVADLIANDERVAQMAAMELAMLQDADDDEPEDDDESETDDESEDGAESEAA